MVVLGRLVVVRSRGWRNLVMLGLLVLRVVGVGIGVGVEVLEVLDGSGLSGRRGVSE